MAAVFCAVDWVRSPVPGVAAARPAGSARRQGSGSGQDQSGRGRVGVGSPRRERAPLSCSLCALGWAPVDVAVTAQVLFFRNVFPDNLFQASFEQVLT